MRDGVKSTSAIALAGSGVTAAFCLAACCAIPILLAALGLSANWLVPIVSASQPHTGILTAFSLAALAGSIVIAWRAPKYCEPGSLCARPGFRWTVTAVAIIGAVLLVLAQVYA